MTLKQFENKTAVITGAASGIGRESVFAFANAGANVVIADIDELAGASLQFEIIKNGGRALFIATDVADSANIQAMIDEAVNSFGSIDFAFNNAGIESNLPCLTADYSEELFLSIININLSSVWRCMKYQLEVMLKQGSGVIINNASILGKVGFKTASPYSAAKHGVIGLTKTAAIEYAQKGIRVNAVCPGFIETPMLERMGLHDNEKLKKSLEQMHPMNRLGTSEEVAKSVVWLCSDSASFITGTTLDVDGGYLSK